MSAMMASRKGTSFGGLSRMTRLPREGGDILEQETWEFCCCRKLLKITSFLKP